MSRVCLQTKNNKNKNQVQIYHRWVFQDLTIYLPSGNAAGDFPTDLSISLLTPIIFKNENMYIALVAGVEIWGHT